ncbi:MULTISPECIES: cyclic peptide export ABC transporter [unclassified Cedecea]|uniref:cyclic peptide export ABC transporter n=1 Tax=unclassified Cedecea TaxID=2649846 RepID=UPI00301639CF
MSLLMMLFRLVGGWLVLAAFASVVSGLSNASLLAVINHSLTLPPGGLADVALQFVLLAALMLGTRVLAETLFMWLGQKVKATLRKDVVDHVSETAWAQLEKTGMAKAVSILTQDLDTLVVFFVSLPGLLIYGAAIIGCLIYLGTLSWQVLLLALLVLGLGAMGYRAAHGKALGLLRSSRQREDTLIAQCKKLFDGGREFRLNPSRRRHFVDGPLSENIEAVRIERTRGYVFYGLAKSWGSVLFFAFIGVVLYWLRESLALSSAVMTGYTMIFLYMIVPVEGVLSALPTVTSARIALQRIAQLKTDLPQEKLLPLKSPPRFDGLELADIRYEYQGEEGERFTLGPLNLRFTQGELVFLVGGNGSGKTTLANLLVGLYPPDSGDLRLNGRLITPEQREIYRQHFAVVFNDFFLFDDVDNVHERTADQVNKLLHLLKLDHKVAFRGGRFSTTALSQGQRKRLALLQAWLENRPFYLFDEWAADQDPGFKEVFYKVLLPMLKAEGKTVLAITHDDRYFPLADRLIKLESGQVVADSVLRPLSA